MYIENKSISFKSQAQTDAVSLSYNDRYLPLVVGGAVCSPSDVETSCYYLALINFLSFFGQIMPLVKELV